VTFQSVYNKYALTGVISSRTMELKLNAMFAELYGEFPGLRQQEIKLTNLGPSGVADSYGETLRKIREMTEEIEATSGLKVDPSQVVYPGLFQNEVIDRLGIFSIKRATLLPLLVGGLSVTENSTPATLVGGVAGGSLGSTVSLADDAGGRVVLTAGNIRLGTTLVDFEGTPTFQFALRQTMPGMTDRTDYFTVTVINVPEAPSLGIISLSANTSTIATPSSGTILGATLGSLITCSNLPAGLTLGSEASRTWSYNGGGSPGVYTLAFLETLSDSPNSPRITNFAFTIQASASSATISGDPSEVVVGQPYIFQYIVTPPGTAVTLDSETSAFWASRSVTHDGFGLLTSASVT
jgi:hypothetical protein